MSKDSDLFERITHILKLARSGVSRTVNTTQVVTNWLIGRELVEEEQHGRAKTRYGDELLRSIADRLQNAFGSGYVTPSSNCSGSSTKDTPICWMDQLVTRWVTNSSSSLTNRKRFSQAATNSTCLPKLN